MATHTTPQRARTREKENRALEERKAGHPYWRIAELVGYANASVARQAVIRALERAPREVGPEVRDLELTRLDALLEGVWPAAVGGDEKAVDRAVKIIELRSRMLGLHHDQGVAEKALDAVRVSGELLLAVLTAVFDDRRLGLSEVQRREARLVAAEQLRALPEGGRG